MITPQGERGSARGQDNDGRRRSLVKGRLSVCKFLGNRRCLIASYITLCFIPWRGGMRTRKTLMASQPASQPAPFVRPSVGPPVHPSTPPILPSIHMARAHRRFVRRNRRCVGGGLRSAYPASPYYGRRVSIFFACNFVRPSSLVISSTLSSPRNAPSTPFSRKRPARWGRWAKVGGEGGSAASAHDQNRKYTTMTTRGDAIARLGHLWLSHPAMHEACAWFSGGYRVGP